MFGTAMPTWLVWAIVAGGVCFTLLVLKAAVHAVVKGLAVLFVLAVGALLVWPRLSHSAITDLKWAGGGAVTIAAALILGYLLLDTLLGGDGD